MTEKIPTKLVYPEKDLKEVGDYCFIVGDWVKQGLFITIICPGCKKGSSIGSNHEIKISKDGKLTTTPSVLHEVCGGHYYITDGMIEMV